jgi:hypothetical protein
MMHTDFNKKASWWEFSTVNDLRATVNLLGYFAGPLTPEERGKMTNNFVAGR